MISVALVLAALVAYAIGILGRQVGWALIRARDPSEVETVQGQRRTLGARVFRGLVPAPRRLSGPQLREHIERSYGVDAVRDALRGHQALEFALQQADHGPARTYAKLWLLERHPAAGVSHHEVEINVFIAMVWPIILTPFVLAANLDVWERSPLGATVVVVLVGTLALLVARGSLLRAQDRRRDEGIDALRHFCVGRWIDEGSS